ncbi:MAG TPA: hypothetical protein VEB64_18450 [Azospirillaceae bacterium]|nr:hypothetical protein [Azospirillaceae bacterium]
MTDGADSPSPAPPRRDRLVALFLAGLIAFNPPFLNLFGAGDVTVFGWPLLYVYVFTAWAALIALLALSVERHRNGKAPPTRRE